MIVTRSRTWCHGDADLFGQHWSRQSDCSKERAVLSITPAAAGAIADLVADRDGAGRPIYPTTGDGAADPAAVSR
jgi:hypothetical protein